MEDWKLFAIVFGCLLGVNLLSLLFVWLFRKEVIPVDKGRKAFFVFWMCLCGFLYWVTVGIGKLIEWIRKKSN